MATKEDPDSGLYGHADALDLLNRSVPLEQKLAAIHEALYAQADFVDRISVAAYDRATDLLKTFLASAPGRNDLVRYEARLSELPSLSEILRTGHPRVVNDLGKLALPDRILLKAGRLSDAEREEMEQHTVRGLEMVEALVFNAKKVEEIQAQFRDAGKEPPRRPSQSAGA